MAEFLGFLIKDPGDDGIFLEKELSNLFSCPPEFSFYSLFEAITAGDHGGVKVVLKVSWMGI